MEKFLLFGFDTYYPSGGITDLIGRFDSLGEIKDYIENISPAYRHDWYQVYDAENMIELDLDFLDLDLD